MTRDMSEESELNWLIENDPNFSSLKKSQNVVSKYWLLAEEYRVVDAVILILGLEPQGLADSIRYNMQKNKPIPPEFKAANAAVSSALNLGRVEGSLIRETEEVYGEGYVDIPGSVDMYRSTVYRESLVTWLKERNFTDCIWFPKSAVETGFRNKNHPRYSAKLAAVVEAWEAFDEESNEAGRPKQRLAKWLRLNAARFGLTNEEGLPSETVVEALAKVANWDTGGGAPKSSDGESEPDL